MYYNPTPAATHNVSLYTVAHCRVHPSIELAGLLKMLFVTNYLPGS